MFALMNFEYFMTINLPTYLHVLTNLHSKLQGALHLRFRYGTMKELSFLNSNFIDENRGENTLTFLKIQHFNVTNNR